MAAPTHPPLVDWPGDANFTPRRFIWTSSTYSNNTANRVLSGLAGLVSSMATDGLQVSPNVVIGSGLVEEDPTDGSRYLGVDSNAYAVNLIERGTDRNQVVPFSGRERAIRLYFPQIRRFPLTHNNFLSLVKRAQSREYVLSYVTATARYQTKCNYCANNNLPCFPGLFADGDRCANCLFNPRPCRFTRGNTNQPGNVLPNNPYWFDVDIARRRLPPLPAPPAPATAPATGSSSSQTLSQQQPMVLADVPPSAAVDLPQAGRSRGDSMQSVTSNNSTHSAPGPPDQASRGLPKSASLQSIVSNTSRMSLDPSETGSNRGNNEVWEGLSDRVNSPPPARTDSPPPQPIIPNTGRYAIVFQPLAVQNAWNSVTGDGSATNIVRGPRPDPQPGLTQEIYQQLQIFRNLWSTREGAEFQVPLPNWESYARRSVRVLDSGQLALNRGNNQPLLFWRPLQYVWVDSNDNRVHVAAAPRPDPPNPPQATRQPSPTETRPLFPPRQQPQSQTTQSVPQQPQSQTTQSAPQQQVQSQPQTSTPLVPPRQQNPQSTNPGNRPNPNRRRRSRNRSRQGRGRGRGQ